MHTNHSKTAMIRTASIVLFGAIPAAFNGWWMGPIALLGGIAVVSTDAFSGLVVFASGLAALGGTLCLWFAAFKKVGAYIVIGLIAGMIAISPLTYGVVTRVPTYNGPFVQFTFVGPFFVAAYLVGEFFISRFKGIETARDVTP